MVTSHSEPLKLPAEVVERFPADASQDVKRAFATRLVEALNIVSVQPGEKFVVMREADLDTEREAHEDEIKILNEELDHEKDSNMYEGELWELVEDLMRGITTMDDIKNFMRRHSDVPVV